MNHKIKKIILLNIPYLFMGLLATKFELAWRLAEGANASEKVTSLMQTLATAFSDLIPSFHPFDLCVGMVVAAIIRTAVYIKGKNAKKYRKNIEYGSARWGTPEDIAPYVDPVFRKNVILTQTERLTIAKQRLAEFETLLCKIYEDHLLGKLPDARYAVLDAQYSKEQGALADEIAELEPQMQSIEQVKKSVDRFIGMIGRYEHFDVLSNRMLNELIQRVVVHEREHKGCQDTTQEVEIYFNFVGRYVPPHFGEVALTQEEQEALRIKQAIREKRHQNYLRRKANGTQQLIDARYATQNIVRAHHPTIKTNKLSAIGRMIQRFEPLIELVTVSYPPKYVIL